MGRKGIGKFSAFGIANEIEVETARDGEISRFIMNYPELERSANDREIKMPALPLSGEVQSGTIITLRDIKKFHTRGIDIQSIRRGLARRFSIIGLSNNFEIFVNESPITPEERDLQRLLDKTGDGIPYIWKYEDIEIKEGTEWRVSRWIGALDRTSSQIEVTQRGIVVMARGKLVQEPFVFDAVVGQQYALSYLVGELHAEFVDEAEDTIGTTRNSLIWDTEANAAFKEWGQHEVNKIAREWAEKRSRDNEQALLTNPLYQKFKEQVGELQSRRLGKVAENLIKQQIQHPLVAPEDTETTIEFCLDYMQFDAFQEMAQDIMETETDQVDRLVSLFREWEVVEAKEMMRVTTGRITTIEKLESLIKENALEVPTLHNFLKEFPWILDPRWTLVADEKTYSNLLREEFPEDADTLEEDKRIDFLCVQESSDLIVVEIKRPRSKSSQKELAQIEEYVNFMRDYVSRTTDPSLRAKDVVGYLLCGETVNTPQVRQRVKNLERASIYVRRYADLLQMVENSHTEFLNRYKELRTARGANT